MRWTAKYSRVSKGSWTSEQGQKIEGPVEEFVFIELQLRTTLFARFDYKSSVLSRGRGRR